MNCVQKKRGDELRKRPECTEKRKARFIQGDRPEAGVELAMTASGSPRRPVARVQRLDRLACRLPFGVAPLPQLAFAVFFYVPLRDRAPI